MANVYVATDSGPSGFGEAGRGVIEHLIEHDDIKLTVRTHQWGLNRGGHHFQERSYPDTRQAERLLRERRINGAYLIDRPADMADRPNDLIHNLGTNTAATDDRCLIRQFDGPEDVWLAIGAMSFARQAPEHGPYTIVSTDYNLDTVPETWPDHIDRVDEVWVPSEWTKQAIVNRDAEAAEKVRVMRYGVNMAYEPTEYDCTICPHNRGQGAGVGMKCLRDGTFQFLVVSRFYHIKGVYRTVRAYLEEFTGEDDVRLIVKTTSNQQFPINPGAAIQAMGQRFAPYEPPMVYPLIQSLEVQQLYDLMGHVDCFLQLSRAECFGLAQLQSAYCKTPVIYSDHSAQRELLDDATEGFYPVSEGTVERPRQEWPQGAPGPQQQQIALPFHMPIWPGAPPDDEAYPPDAKWFSPSLDEIRARMREVYERWQDDPDELDAHGEAAHEYVQDNFKWKDAIQPRMDRLREVADG